MDAVMFDDVRSGSLATKQKRAEIIFGHSRLTLQCIFSDKVGQRTPPTPRSVRGDVQKTDGKR